MKKSRLVMSEKEFYQDLENSVAIGIFTSAMNELENESYQAYKRLRSCQAYVYSTDNYYILKSYDSFIAVIDKRTFAIADVLRHVYDYAATSAQHISKFIHDYTPYPWNSARYTYRDI